MISVTIRQPAAGIVRTHFECSECGQFTDFSGFEKANAASLAAHLEAVLAGAAPDISARSAAEQAALVTAAEVLPTVRKELRDNGCRHV